MYVCEWSVCARLIVRVCFCVQTTSRFISSPPPTPHHMNTHHSEPMSNVLYNKLVGLLYEGEKPSRGAHYVPSLEQAAVLLRLTPECPKNLLFLADGRPRCVCACVVGGLVECVCVCVENESHVFVYTSFPPTVTGSHCESANRVPHKVTQFIFIDAYI
jgi:hypothetical protein